MGAVAVVGAILVVGVVGFAVARGPARVEEGHGSINGLSWLRVMVYVVAGVGWVGCARAFWRFGDAR